MAAAPTESRKKAFAWTDLITGVAVDGLAMSPMSRFRCLWVVAPLFVQAGIATFAEPLTYTGVAQVAAKRYGQLWLPCVVLAVMSLLKKTRTFDKIVEKPVGYLAKVVEPVEGESALKQFVKKASGPTIRAALHMMVEYPLQTIMYRMATDTQSSGQYAALIQALRPGMNEGCPFGLEALKGLYIGYDVTLYGVILGATLMSMGELSGNKVLNGGTQISSGIISLFTDALALRMVCTRTWSPAVAFALVQQVEGMYWVLRGLPLLIAENLLPVLLDGLRSKVVNRIFADVIKSSEDAQQQHIQTLMAHMREEQLKEQAAKEKKSE